MTGQQVMTKTQATDGMVEAKQDMARLAKRLVELSKELEATQRKAQEAKEKYDTYSAHLEKAIERETA